MSKYFAVVLLLVNIGCIGYGLNCKRPSTTEQSNAYYGKELAGAELVEQKMAFEISTQARLPYKASFRYLPPYKGFIVSTKDCRTAYGYVLTAYVSTKNSYGGPAGEKRYDSIYLRGVHNSMPHILDV